ncbi:MAG: hypothetical protein ACT4NY_28035 [Pseudonocardiales bacterium]
MVVGVVFVRRQRRLDDPLLDLRLFRVRTFSVALGALTLGAVVLMGVGYLTAQYLQLVLGLSALEAGLWSPPRPPRPHGTRSVVPRGQPISFQRHCSPPPEAFTDGLQVAAMVSAVALATLAVASAVVLRRV